jgi:translation elongation factor aEF-1 beta
MGKALVIFKIFTDPEELDNVAKELENVTIEQIKFQDLKREPIGFGIEVIRVGYIVPDKTDGLMPQLEEAISKIKGITQVEMDGVTLIS